ncbi:DUF6029 family protein [Porphyromonas sp. COT-108 OH1349]|uniref:DUF6029 family protein n=1 Tax=Porphyromonas sp. COT-108 OH1349 TaxID=1537504 RepID=UPI00052CDBA8|nr:DUF6029 family protein [Porphyromonas sp. COT-108 OH1349]KGN70608.1 hypothetical protein JT26_03940 [Porphyromonas sp. COT-108 OH1349]
MKRRFNAILCALGIVAIATPTILAQNEKKEKYWGRLNGGIESNAALYKKDENDPDAKNYGDNTYLNLRYNYKNFNAGLQYELYLPPLKGFSQELKGHGLTHYYLNYSAEKLNVTLGSFYEQFGSGLIFRAYEERALGINNSLRGLNIKYTPSNWLTLKAMGGQPRRYMEYADAFMWGGDAELSAIKLFKKESEYDVTLGGSWVSRHNTKTIEESEEPARVDLFSTRAGFYSPSFNLGIEYTGKGMSQTFSPAEGSYPAEAGDALLINADYIRPNFGISGVFRRIEHMDFRIDNKLEQLYIPINYVPALTKQHKYTLPGLHPHVTELGGEIGGQVDLFWNISGTALGKYPLKIALNASHYKSLGNNFKKTMPFFGQDGSNLFSEVALEVGKQINRSIKTTIGLYYQNKFYISENYDSYIGVIDFLWRANRKLSLRTELQYMSTEMEEKGWLFGLLEVGFAPNWMVYVSDMYNHGGEKKEHFYMAGCSFTYNGLRLTASYGRSRAGTQCVGGICRFVPEYTGLMAGLSYTF